MNNEQTAAHPRQSEVLCLIIFAEMSGSAQIAEFIAFRFVSGACAFMSLAGIPVSKDALSQKTETHKY